MNRAEDGLTYEAWLAFVFDHPVSDPSWWWDDHDELEAVSAESTRDPARLLAFLTRLFREPGGLIERYSREQIDQGFMFLISSACSNQMYPLVRNELPWPDRLACIEAIVPLFEKLMGPVYGDDTAHLQTEAEKEKPTFSCYMWWDVIAICPHRDDEGDRLELEACLRVMERVLALPWDSCRESALHGLGHWEYFAAERTRPIVQKFLERTDLKPAIRAYAEAALDGGVQ